MTWLDNRSSVMYITWSVTLVCSLFKFLQLGNLKERDHLEDLHVDRNTILKGILNRLNERHGLHSSGLLQGQVADCCETSHSVTCGNFMTS